MGSRYDTPHDQFVIAYLPRPNESRVVISHALALAQMLRKGLILLYVEDARYGGLSKAEATAHLQRLVESLRPQHADTQYAALQGDTRQIIAQLPHLLYGVVAVAECCPAARRHSPTHPREVLRLFGQSKIAYLTAQQPLTGAYTDVAFSIDYRRESKEKLIWASYFARFGRSRLHTVSQQYSDERLRQKWDDNLRFMAKIFGSLGITAPEQHSYRPHGLFAETAVVETAATAGCNLLISTTTEGYDRDVVEWIVGTAEQRTVRNPQQLPVLFINPRDDLFVLCD